MATLEEIKAEIASLRVQMDCASEHCSGCPYLIGGVCELAESVYLAAVDY